MLQNLQQIANKQFIKKNKNLLADPIDMGSYNCLWPSSFWASDYLEIKGLYYSGTLFFFFSEIIGSGIIYADIDVFDAPCGEPVPYFTISSYSQPVEDGYSALIDIICTVPFGWSYGGLLYPSKFYRVKIKNLTDKIIFIAVAETQGGR